MLFFSHISHFQQRSINSPLLPKIFSVQANQSIVGGINQEYVIKGITVTSVDEIDAAVMVVEGGPTRQLPK